MKQRIKTLDDVRVWLMLMGVVLHAALLIGGNYNQDNHWSWLAGTIHLFRMQAFFVISGYLGWFSMNKPQYLGHRSRQLLLPAVTALCIIFPVIEHYWPQSPFSNDFDFSSMWFLVTLYLLVVGNWLLMKNRLGGVIVRFASEKPIWAIGLAVFTQFAIVTITAILGDGRHWATMFGYKSIVAQTVNYELYYLGGLILAQIPQWQEKLKAQWWRYVGLGCFIGWSIISFVSPLTANLVPIHVTAAILVTLGIISFATQAKSPLTMPRFWCAASLTVYIWHYPIIITEIKLWNKFSLIHSHLAEFIWLCGSSFIISLVAHRVINTNKWLEWLCLGKPRPALPFRLSIPFKSPHQYGYHPD